MVFFLFVIQEVIPDWQQAASNILVAVGNKYINDIMEEILSKFQPGVLPHFFVVQTLANLSDSNGRSSYLEKLRWRKCSELLYAQMQQLCVKGKSKPFIYLVGIFLI